MLHLFILLGLLAAGALVGLIWVCVRVGSHAHYSSKLAYQIELTRQLKAITHDMENKQHG
jgi:hypothetical protein